MTGEEGRLYARAEMLDETRELAQAVAEVLTGAQGVGVDPRAVISLTAALQAPAPAPVTARAARRTGGRDPGTAPTASSSRRFPVPRTRSGSTSAK
jgi:hypothetical protein